MRTAPTGSITDTVSLANGVAMPRLGLGTWRSAEGAEVEQSVRWALEIGYRHVDTAAVYGNERGVGRAIRDSNVPRERVFVTTKVWNDDQRGGRDAVLRAFDESLRRLGMDYVDLYLVHWPVKGKYVEAWRALEQIYSSGRAKAIGVSNFLVHHLQDVLKAARVRPMVNQVEFHPRLVQRDLLDFCRKEAIVPEAWSPLMKGKAGEVPLLRELAEKYGKTPSQVVLRWDLQHGVVTIPKSVRRERLAENADLFDFELSADEMAKVDALDRGERIGADPDHFTF
jgi:diketogulonate reductase-like aldo/keto reductase